MRTAPRRVRAGIVPVSICVALTLSACGGSDEASGTGATAAPGAGAGSGEQLTIGFSPTTLQAPALAGLAKGLEGYAKSKGYKVLVADAKADVATQVQQTTGWIQRGQIDALWVIPVSSGSMASVVTLAKQKKVAVLVAGEPQDLGKSGPEAALSFSAVDNAAYGAALGEQLSKCITERFDGAGKIINMTPPPSGSATDKKIQDAILATLSTKLPNSKVVATVNAGATRLTAQQNAAGALSAHRDANAFIGTNDEIALGALGAFTAAGKDASKACIVGAGGGEEAVGAVKKKQLYAEIAFDFEKDLAQNVDALAAMAKDPAAPGSQLQVPFITVTE